ncbi:MAG: hypothetical protein LBQ73_11080 [Tannerellaceae bacterium]|jgi:hypothetical protein|nr:hypothetical protein [Tannerellaceae bacterium]
MKHVAVKVKIEKTYIVSFDEGLMEKENIIHEYKSDIDDNVCDKPEEFSRYSTVKEKDFPYFNLAKTIAYQKAQYDNEDVEGLPYIHNTNYAEPKGKPVIIKISETDEDVIEYEFDWDRMDTNSLD